VWPTAEETDHNEHV